MAAGVKVSRLHLMESKIEFIEILWPAIPTPMEERKKAKRMTCPVAGSIYVVGNGPNVPLANKRKPCFVFLAMNRRKTGQEQKAAVSRRRRTADELMRSVALA